ncbi:helix-turn-helix transcriptional regulator [Eubacteriaceae bacterium ES2]|nr:helix-turn-helix transcriptional regulator [Eubacteriaceae bacterium ES2]
MRAKLKEIRISRGFTQKALADMAEIDRSFYTNIELGVKTPSLQVAMKIKKALEYYDDDIFLIINVA